MLQLIYGHPHQADAAMGTALEAYVNGIPLPAHARARLWKMVREAEAKKADCAGKTAPSLGAALGELL